MSAAAPISLDLDTRPDLDADHDDNRDDIRDDQEPGDAGMSTAEYAIGTVAACAFAGVLYGVVRSGAVATLLQGVVERALSLGT